MSLEDVFPQDPWLPSLRYAACSLIPFNLPWGPRRIEIGTGFHSSKLQTDNPFATEFAFNKQAVRAAPLKYRSASTGVYTHNESSFGSHSREHMEFSLGASASIAIVKVSGQARFEENAAKDADGIKSSLTGKLYAGYVEFEDLPPFCLGARDALRREGTYQEQDLFENKYGDYYVSALRIGAANGTELSAGSSSQFSSEAKSYSITVTVKVFCWSASTTKSGSSFESSMNASATIKFNGYDTLSSAQIQESGSSTASHDKIIAKANTNLGKGKLLQGRLKEEVCKFELYDGCSVSHEQVGAMLDSGLVMEIQLMPYAKLKEYISLRGRNYYLTLSFRVISSNERASPLDPLRYAVECTLHRMHRTVDAMGIDWNHSHRITNSTPSVVQILIHLLVHKMAMLAPYNDSMKLGSGFNSFTQELCLDGAVTREDGGKAIEPATQQEKPPVHVAQQVTYKTSIIDKVSDVFDTLNINAAFTVKFGKGSVEGGADFLNVSKIKNADLTFMVSCKVINQVTMDQTLTRFSPIQGLKPADFPRVYGDSFISGFQEGGEFTAIISVRAKDRSQANTMKADASVSFTLEKPSAKNENGSGADVDLGMNKIKREILTENETTISVTWTGGGQNLKKPEEDWTFDTMRAVALKFPDEVAKCPMKTHAVLTKYTSLKSFHTSSVQFNPLSYENARVYTAALRDAFLDYQNISKSLSVLALDVNAGTHKLIAQKDKVEKNFAKETLKASDPNLLQNFLDQTQSESMEKTVKAKSGASDEETMKQVDAPAPISDAASEEEVVVNASSEPDVTSSDVPGKEDGTENRSEATAPPKSTNPLVIDQPYPPTIYGLESARMQCRFMMNRIVAEVDKVANYPEIAADETRPLPYMSPFLFNMLLPAGHPLQ
ncbi:hypothetical protein F66182_3095 [Fusarium sp. NRRL 66182]|nr:hypothetical protein F66182_3095 [Fusarium sp. NRRL 66182]